MASIKEIAKLAQVSQGTASIVLNGKGDQFRISSATQQKIFEAAKQLDYRPNISARRLRSGGETVSPVIALFWTLDTRTPLIGRFLKGVQDSISTFEEEYDLLIQPYVGSRINEVRSLLTGTRFNGAIIANPTEEDERYLEQVDPNVPIVLYQRSSDKYSYVNVDNDRTGREVARLFYQRGHRRLGIVIPDASSAAIRLRKEGFLDAAREVGAPVAPEHIVYSDFSETGGYEAIQRLFQSGGMPTALFVLSDQMSVGALMALNERGIRVPQEMELVSHDDYEVARYTIPPLTTMHLPVEEMANACVQILIDLMYHKAPAPIQRHFETHLVVRKSCGNGNVR